MKKISFLILVIILFSNIPAVQAESEFSFTLLKTNLDDDSDNDGLSDHLEKVVYKTLSNNKDTDNDGFFDGLEIKNGFSPLHSKLRHEDVDTDNDGVNDLWELRLGSNIVSNDSDNDGVSDFDELRDGTSLVSGDKKVMKKEIIVDVKNFTMKLVQNSIVLEEIEVSTGKKGWETPKGNFNILAKVDVKNYFNHPNIPYNLEFAFNKGWKIYIHSAPWHNDCGKKNVSTGCVNVPQEKMKEVYAWANSETTVTVY